MAIFLDSGFFTGLCHPGDEFSAASKRILLEMSEGKFRLIYTSPLVVSETATLLLVRTNNNQTLLKKFYYYLFGPKKFVRMLPWSPQIEELTWDLFLDINSKVKARKNWLSFVDVSNIAYCRHNQIQHIASYDKHFDSFLIRIY